MKLTKYTHSCVRLEHEGKILVLDPGNFSEVSEALEGADYLLITHGHPDHYDPERVDPYLQEHPEVRIYAPAPVAEQMSRTLPNSQIQAVAGAESITLDGFNIKTFGGQHALIHPLIPMIPNVGYFINDNLYHPGDNFVVPDGVNVKTLLVPIHAPWNKIGEVIDFVASVRAPRAYQIHDSLLADSGRTMIGTHTKNFAARYGTEFSLLEPKESVEIS
ncbi:MBL fold metallo-hydrolase [Rothia sp. P7181]|uniref:MBL fold metallo-hydrolase n=1 Tax=Rothia sp. P7181 TaxID=3402663 RepID=UPI003AEDD9B0